jgi:hypothetical protein
MSEQTPVGPIQPAQSKITGEDWRAPQCPHTEGSPGLGLRSLTRNHCNEHPHSGHRWLGNFWEGIDIRGHPRFWKILAIYSPQRIRRPFGVLNKRTIYHIEPCRVKKLR